MHKIISQPFYIKLACTLITLLALGYIMYIGQVVIVPLILGLLFAMLLVPACNWLETKLRFPRTLAAIVALLAFFGVIIALFTLITSQLTMLKEDWPLFEQQIVNELNVLHQWIANTFDIDYQKQTEYINDTLSKSLGKGTAFLGVALVSLSSLVILLVFTFLYTFFLLLYRRHIVRFLILLNKKEHENVVREIVQEIQYVVKKYLIGLVLQMCIVATMTFTVLSIVGVKYSVMLALITGVFNVLPYVGIFVSIFIISLITFATSSITNVLFVIIGLWMVHLIDSNFVVPKIVGSKVKVNSLFALLAIISGELLWGISGMFLAIPVLAIAKIVCDRIYELKPWGFLLGEEDSDEHSFDTLKKYLHLDRFFSDEGNNKKGG